MKLSFTIPGAPRTKKTSNRIVLAGGRRRVLPSKAYEKWFSETKWHGSLAKTQARLYGAVGMFPILPPVRVCAIFYRDANRGDLTGYEQALGDWLQAAGIIGDDKQIVSWDGTRLDVDRERPRIELTLTVAECKPANG